MPELSLVMIVKNEERPLLHCLDSVRDIVNDAVVADTGSSDRTVDVAREWGARVMEVPWTDDFSAARNTALAAAAHSPSTASRRTASPLWTLNRIDSVAERTLPMRTSLIFCSSGLVTIG
ncbi:MAG: glycosyltransferase [Candidatus Hydrogenedentes bacterium]|nr:glycosyltransferase [Candidatus Hydrogenedentota bacterium]